MIWVKCQSLFLFLGQQNQPSTSKAEGQPTIQQTFERQIKRKKETNINVPKILYVALKLNPLFPVKKKKKLIYPDIIELQPQYHDAVKQWYVCLKETYYALLTIYIKSHVSPECVCEV